MLFFSESGCKGKNFFEYLPNIFGSFFSVLFRPPLSSLAKGRVVGKEGVLLAAPGVQERIVKHRCFLFESGCKGKNFISYLPNFSGSFFSFFFSTGMVLVETGTGRKKKDTFSTRSLSECQFIAAPVSESGCKSRGFIITTQIYPEVFLYGF